MSNARNLANLLGNGTTIATASIADDAITAAKIDDDGTGFTFGDLNVAGAVVGDGFTAKDKLKLDGSSVATVTVNSAVSASATIVVDGVAGTIVVGMVVNVSDISVRSISDAASQTAISTDDSLTITAVASQTSFTVSEAVTIADNVVLILTADENQGFVLDASAASTDVGEEILFEDATGDGSTLLKDGLPGGIAINNKSLPAGSVLQVLQTTSITAITVTTTASEAILTATMTPRSSESKIMIFAQAACEVNGGSSGILGSTIRRGTFEGEKLSQFYTGPGSGSSVDGYITAQHEHLDSPATDQPVTYSFCISRGSGGTTNVKTIGSVDFPYYITLMEIA